MRLVELLAPERIACDQVLTSKKRALEVAGQLLASASPSLAATDVFTSLIGRERLGSTGLGRGVALPHARLRGLTAPVGALITLHDGIDYDALDGQRVDILFALAVPEQATGEHLQILALLAEWFSDPDHGTRLRAVTGPDAAWALFNAGTAATA